MRRRGSPASAAFVGVALLAVLFAGVAGARATTPVSHRHELTNATVAHWAPVLRRVAAHRRPDASSRVVAKVATITSDWTQNIVLVLDAIERNPGETWFRVRLSILPNNSTGWVPRDALGNLYAVHTHLYVNRATYTATLKRNGRTIFKTYVGVGRAATPTPAGEFYIRDQVAGFHDPFYGPIAFGTNGRSRVLTDWPGGGLIGVHGTNRPGILPGAVSHGCIRMVNRAIVRLARLMPLGTPLTVT